MNFESFNTGNEKEAQDQVVKATSEADPTTYSMLPPEKMRTKILRPLNEYNLPVRTGENETYYELSNLHDPRGQQVVARILKGILNVSDVVSVPAEGNNDKYYSWKIPLGKIEENTPTEQVEAEQLLLQYLFNSKDHLFNENSGWANNARYEDNKLAHFDFGEDAYRFLETPSGRDTLLARLRNMSTGTIDILQSKVSALQERFGGKSGKEFFQSIIEASAAPITELFGPQEVFAKHPNIDPVDLVYSTLIKRIESLGNSLHEVGSRK